MAVLVQLKNIKTGEVTTHFSVDAADILPQGEHVQIGGPRVSFAPAKVVVPPEPGPPVLTSGGEPSLKHRGGKKWDVLNADGSKANTDALSKADAEALLATLK